MTDQHDPMTCASTQALVANMLADKAQRDRFKAFYPQLVTAIVADQEALDADGPPKPIPALSEITALQVSLWDNTERPNGGKHPYTLEVRVWTADRIVFGQTKARWEKTAVMWAAKDAAEAVKVAARAKNKYPLNAATVASVKSVAAQGGDFYVGVLRQKGRAVNRYSDEHVIYMEFRDGVIAQAGLFTPHLQLALPPFVPTDAKGTALRQNCALQSRFSNCERLAPWTTG